MRVRKTPKLSVVFDEEKRREYLTGFHKRKVRRKEEKLKAAEDRLAEEVRAVKSRYREAARKRLEGITLPCFLDENLGAVTSHEEHAIDNHTVVVEEIDVSNSHYFMGSNQLNPQIPETEPLVERPLMSLKAALKMNPKRKSTWRSKKTKRKAKRAVNNKIRH